MVALMVFLKDNGLAGWRGSTKGFRWVAVMDVQMVECLADAMAVQRAASMV